jgi:acyl dehydratase
VTERLEDLERGAYVVARPVPIAKRIVRPPLTWYTFEFLNPLPVGSRVRSRARVVDKYRRRDRPYVVVECLTETEDGTPILRSRATLLI